jgi:peptide/nickel transport system permease protein
MEERNELQNELVTEQVLPENDSAAVDTNVDSGVVIELEDALAPAESEEPIVQAEEAPTQEEDEPHEKNVRLMSPARMVLRRFFRSKLSIVGLIIIVSLFLFCWVGPIVYDVWGETAQDKNGEIEYTYDEITYTENGETYTFYQVVETKKTINSLARPDSDHILGTDKDGRDVFTRLMYGGRISLAVSFIAVFTITFLGIIFGGVAGYFGGKVDNVIMRICDVLMCLPGFPILLIIGTLLDSADVPSNTRIYFLMAFLTLFSWPGTARLVRGQILYLREQEYMVAAEAMGYSTKRKIFKHLVPNVMPQLIVSMTLSLGSMILYEASLSYLNMGVRAPYAAWGTMINIVAEDQNILQNFFNVWGPPGICIILAVLGFNFIGDGLRDALDPKMRR